MDFDVILDSLPMYGQGALVTLALLALSLGFGMLLALPLAMLRSLPSPWAWRPVWAFTYVMRGTPLLVQVFLLYYGLAQFEVVREMASQARQENEALKQRIADLEAALAKRPPG